MEALATTLSHLMSQVGIKSAELARQTGIGQPVIYRLMTGVTENPQILTIKPLADFFKISIDQLLGFAPLDNLQPLSDKQTHDFNNKISTIKTIGSVLVELLPALIEGYQKAAAIKLVDETIPNEILPLLSLNTLNLLKSANQIHDLINNKNNISQDS